MTTDLGPMIEFLDRVNTALAAGQPVSVADYRLACWLSVEMDRIFGEVA